MNNDRAARVELPLPPEAIGTAVAFLDSGGLDRRRYQLVSRLRALHDSDQFATLPEDLRERVRKIVADTGAH